MPISPITDILDDLRHGRMVVIMDDEDRENEGDLLMAAQHVRPEDVNFMATHGRGLICITLTEAHCRQLNLPLMTGRNLTPFATNFTVSIEAARGVTTGISAQDRAVTIQTAIRAEARPEDIVQPGHIFPLMARTGGVLTRAGHTEAGVDLARLAGLAPAAAICEILNEDGSMARQPDLEVFAHKHGLRIGTIADLIRYRLETESTVRRVGESRIRNAFGEFRAVAYHDDIGGGAHLALVRGDIRREWPCLARVHVQSGLLDAIGAESPGCVWTLQNAMRRIAEEGAGVVVVLSQSQGADDLAQQLKAREPGARRAETPPSRAQQAMRNYGLGSQILADLGIGKLRLLSHAVKTPGLSGFGIEIVEYLTPEDDAAKHLTVKERK